MTENLKLPEPEWVLDRDSGGALVWRSDISRVQFKHDVEIKEFHRKSFELHDPPWIQKPTSTNLYAMSFTCLACLTVSLILPWYILGGTL